jgi:hypothetical protein
VGIFFINKEYPTIHGQSSILLPFEGGAVNRLREVGSPLRSVEEGRCEMIKNFGSPRPNGEREVVKNLWWQRNKPCVSDRPPFSKGGLEGGKRH